MPPHWWIPVKSSDADTRKKEVHDALEGKGTLNSFWEAQDGTLYALVEDCQLDDALKDALKADKGKEIKLKRKV